MCNSTYVVPQGSNLGPLLFLMYINDLSQVSDLKITLFADDAVLTYTNKNPVTLQSRINDELQKIENRIQINKLTINYNKTNYMIKKIDKSHFSIKIGQNKIHRQDIIKYLGVIIDNGMNWSKHTMYLMMMMMMIFYSRLVTIFKYMQCT